MNWIVFRICIVLSLLLAAKSQSFFKSNGDAGRDARLNLLSR